MDYNPQTSGDYLNAYLNQVSYELFHFRLSKYYNINSRENPKIKYAVELQSNKGRKEHGQFLAEGIKSLELALKAGLVTDIFATKKLNNIPDSVNQYLVKQDLIEKNK